MSFSWEEAVLIQNTLMERKSEEGKCVSEKERERERERRKKYSHRDERKEREPNRKIHAHTDIHTETSNR